MVILLFIRSLCATPVDVRATLLEFAHSVLHRETPCDCHRRSGDSLPAPSSTQPSRPSSTESTALSVDSGGGIGCAPSPTTMDLHDAPNPADPSALVTGGLPSSSCACIQARLDGRPVACLLDSESSFSLLPRTFASSQPVSLYAGESLRSVTGSPVHVYSCVTL